MAAKVPNGSITPASIPLGLLTLDRKSLSTFLAIFEDSSAITLVTDKLGNIGDGAYAKYADWKDGSIIVSQERCTKRIIQTASEIELSDTSDYSLRLALWAHIPEAFDLRPRIAISPRDLDYVANDIGAAISVFVAQKRHAEKKAKFSKKEFEYWKRLVKEANPFGSKRISPVPFDEAVREAVFALFGAALESSKTPDANKRDMISKIRGELSRLDQNVLKEAKIHSLKVNTIQKIFCARRWATWVNGCRRSSRLWSLHYGRTSIGNYPAGGRQGTRLRAVCHISSYVRAACFICRGCVPNQRIEKNGQESIRSICGVSVSHTRAGWENVRTD